MHAAVTGRRELARGAGQPGAAEVLDALDQVRAEELEAALDQDLLGERVADLDAGPLGRSVGVEGLGRQHRHPADAVAAGARAEQHDVVALAGRVGQVQVLVPQRTDAQRVDQRVALVARVEHDLAADVGQAEAVAVAPDAGHDSRHHAVGVRDGRSHRTAASP